MNHEHLVSPSAESNEGNKKSPETLPTEEAQLAAEARDLYGNDYHRIATDLLRLRDESSRRAFLTTITRAYPEPEVQEEIRKLLGPEALH